MARSLGNTRGAYSEIESGRHCLTTPSHSLVNRGVDPHRTEPEQDTTLPTREIADPGLEHRDGTASSGQNSILQDPERDQGDIELQISKPTTVEALRGCAGNWLCLLLGITVLAGSIVMTVFGFIASDFSETMKTVGNRTVMTRDEAMYESLSSLKTYGPILTGCGCFVIMCACVLLCDARDKLRASAEPEEPKSGPEVLTYATVLRNVYEDEIRRKDEEETIRRTQKIDEYFECMSKHPVGRRTLIRAMRPRSLSDPCISSTRSESPLPDVYEYAKERLDIQPIRETVNADNTDTPASSSHGTSTFRPKSATPLCISDISPPGQLLYLERIRQGTLPPIGSRSRNGPIKVDTSSLPVGSLEKLYLGDDNMICGEHNKQKKKKGKRKKRESHAEPKCERTAMKLNGDDPKDTEVKLKHPSSCRLKVSQEAKDSIPSNQPTTSTTKEKQGYRHHGESKAYNRAGEAPGAGRGKIHTAAAVTNPELTPSIRTLKWVEENNEQPWNRTLHSDNRDDPSYQTAGSKSDLRKSSTGSLTFDGSNALSLGHSAMVL